MTSKPLDRKDVQRKAEQLGHCVCSKQFSCPCRFFRNKDICHCANEKHDESYQEWLDYNLKF